MKKDCLTNKLIRRRKKELRQRFFKLSNLKWMIAILLVSIVILVISYFIYECNPWLSGVFVSAGSGGMTGLILYFLSNLRNNRCALLQKDLMVLKSIRHILNQINGFKSYHQLYRKSWGVKRDIFEDGLEIVDLLDELQTIVDDISSGLYKAFLVDDDNPLSYENIEIFKNNLLNADDDNEVQRYINAIVKHFFVVGDKVFDLISEKEDQLMCLGRFVV